MWAAYVGFHIPHPKFIGLKKYFYYYLPKTDFPYIPDDYLFQNIKIFWELVSKFPLKTNEIHIL